MQMSAVCAAFSFSIIEKVWWYGVLGFVSILQYIYGDRDNISMLPFMNILYDDATRWMSILWCMAFVVYGMPKD